MSRSISASLVTMAVIIACALPVSSRAEVIEAQVLSVSPERGIIVLATAKLPNGVEFLADEPDQLKVLSPGDRIGIQIEEPVSEYVLLVPLGRAKSSIKLRAKSKGGEVTVKALMAR